MEQIGLNIGDTLPPVSGERSAQPYLADNETCDQVTGERIKASPKEVRQWKPVHPTGRLWKFKLSQADAWIEAGGAAESDNEKVGP